MYEKNQRHYDRWGRPRSPYVKYKDLYDQVKSEIDGNPCGEIALDPLEKQLDKLKKDGKLNGRVKTLPKRYLLTRRVA